MDEEIEEKKLATCVNRLVRDYVYHRTGEKSGVKYDDLKKDEKGHAFYPEKYREAREDVCRDAFLAMRSRHSQDFTEYFTGTICSVAQYLPEEDYLIISNALINRPDIVKTLSMLSLSAYSSTGRASKNETEEGEEQ